MILLFNLCNSSFSMMIFLIFKYVLNIVCVITPILIIFKTFSIIFPTIIDGKLNSSHLSTIIKSLIAGFIIFLVPSILLSVFNIFTNSSFSSNDVSSCYVNSSLSKVNSLRQQEKLEAEKKREEEHSNLNNEFDKRKENDNKVNSVIKSEKEKNRKELEKNNSTSSSSGDRNGNRPSGTYNIFVGDSRTVGLCATIASDWTNCQFSNGGAFTYGNDIFIAQGSMSYSWFESTAIPAVNNILNDKNGKTYNIITNMGVNMLNYDVDKYVVKYNELLDGSWKNVNVIFLSVNPVDEKIEAQHGYSTKNSGIISFNSKIKSQVPKIGYCDSYNYILNNMNTPDGLHYDGSTYKKIYDKALSCV